MAQVRHSAAEWEELVSGWQASGLSCRGYAEEVGVNPRTLSWWKWKLGGAAPRPRFMELVVQAEPAPELIVEVGALRVRVPCGFDAGELRRLVVALC